MISASIILSGNFYQAQLLSSIIFPPTAREIRLADLIHENMQIMLPKEESSTKRHIEQSTGIDLDEAEIIFRESKLQFWFLLHF